MSEEPFNPPRKDLMQFALRVRTQIDWCVFLGMKLRAVKISWRFSGHFKISSLKSATSQSSIRPIWFSSCTAPRAA
jgi:hypothetical protein